MQLENASWSACDEWESEIAIGGVDEDLLVEVVTDLIWRQRDSVRRQQDLIQSQVQQ